MNDPVLEHSYSYFDPGLSLTRAERDLWSAVFQQALIDHAFDRGRESRRYPTMLEWIEEEREDVGSFKFVCSVVGLDYIAVRKVLRIVTPRQLQVLMRRTNY